MAVDLRLQKKIQSNWQKKLYQRGPQIAWKGISHFRNLKNRFKIYKFQLLQKNKTYKKNMNEIFIYVC